MSDAFLTELNADALAHFKGGVRNNITDIVLTCTVVLASICAAALAAAKLPEDCRWLTVLVAAMPAAFTSIQAKLRIRELSTWYFRYAAALRARGTEMRHDPTAVVADIVARRIKVDHEFENLWFELKTRPEASDTRSTREGSSTGSNARNQRGPARTSSGRDTKPVKSPGSDNNDA